MKLNSLKVSIVLSFTLLSACGGGITKDIPPKPDATSKYIFYLHGSVEESEGSTEKYQAATSAISASSATVITEVRGVTDPNTYAEKLKNQVNTLISKGVPAKNITISGFSKGAIIALASAGIINNPRINYVLLAGCSADLNEKYAVNTANVVGRILSVYDSGDDKFGSCDGIFEIPDNLIFKEIELDSGKGHKVFRIPKEKFVEQWRDPLLEWAGT